MKRRGSFKTTKRRWFYWLIVSLSACFFVFCGLIQNIPTPYVLTYPANFGSRFTIPADNPTTQEGVQLGRFLFYEKKLSATDAISCGTCHEQEKAFTDGKVLSVGIDGTLTPRNSMSLANLLWVRNFFWDGRSPSLEAQAVFPLTDPHEMGQSLAESVLQLRQTRTYPPLFKAAFGSDLITEDQILKALAQFERTLISADSPYDRYLAGTYQLTAQELRGMALFANAPSPQKGLRGANCGHCHGGPKTFKELFHNNGLDSLPTDLGREKATGQVADRGRFRVPTLRNIALTAPYMHDGRFATLQQVLDHYNEHIQLSPTLSTFLQGITNQPEGTSLGLTSSEKSDILAFLNLLTDSTFVTNPSFSDPSKPSKLP